MQDDAGSGGGVELIDRRKALPAYAAISVLAAAIALAHALSLRYMSDDAFVAFRYAKNLVNGMGLVYNAGERVEGYTNFLWTLLTAGALRLGWDPVVFCWTTGLLSFAGALGVNAVLFRRLSGSRIAPFILVAFLTTNFTFRSYATSGLETPLAILLCSCCLLLSPVLATRTPPSTGRTAAFSLFCSLALLTRLDTLLFVGPLVLVAAARLRGTPGRPEGRMRPLAALLTPLAILVGGWLTWKWWYYGAIVPNSAQVKIGGGPGGGWVYVQTFFLSYWLWPLPAAIPLMLLIKRREPWTRTAWFLFGLAALWLAYVIAVGGDFMEFRFIAPALPLLLGLAAWLLFPAGGNVLPGSVVAIVIVAGALSHQFTFRDTKGIDSIATLASLPGYGGLGWCDLGERLARDFGAHSGVTIAVAPAGALSYCSGLRSIDMLGLNDAWIARHGTPIDERPGHRRLTTYSYLVSRGVNIVLDVPRILPAPLPADIPVPLAHWAAFSDRMADPGALPRDATLLEIPVWEGRGWLYVLYLVKHSAIESRIRELHWRTIPLDNPAWAAALPEEKRQLPGPALYNH